MWNSPFSKWLYSRNAVCSFSLSVSGVISSYIFFCFMRGWSVTVPITVLGSQMMGFSDVAFGSRCVMSC